MKKLRRRRFLRHTVLERGDGEKMKGVMVVMMKRLMKLMHHHPCKDEVRKLQTEQSNLSQKKSKDEEDLGNLESSINNYCSILTAKDIAATKLRADMEHDATMQTELPKLRQPIINIDQRSPEACSTE